MSNTSTRGDWQRESNSYFKPIIIIIIITLWEFYHQR